MAESQHQIVISTDGHCGADLWDYKPYLEQRYHEAFDAWADGLPRCLGRRARPGPAGRPPLGRGLGRSAAELGHRTAARVPRQPGDRRRGALPQHPAALLPLGCPHLARAADPGGVRAPLRRPARAQPVAGGLLQRGARSSGGLRADLSRRHRRSRSPRCAGPRRPGSGACCSRATTSSRWSTSTTRSYDPLWAVCAELELPIHRHAVGPDRVGLRGWRSVPARALRGDPVLLRREPSAT